MDSTVLLARVVFWFPAGQELTGGTRVSPVDAARAIAARYNFEKSPQTTEEWTAPDGAVFKYGRWNDTNIPQITIYQRGIAVDTQTSTDDADKILDDIIEWAPHELGVQIHRRPEERKLYLSQLVFTSNMALLHLSPVLDILGSVLGEKLGWISAGQRYETTEIKLNVDTSNLKIAPGPFILARREGVPFSENAYYSSAPLQTALHRALLEKIERHLFAIAKSKT